MFMGILERQICSSQYCFRIYSVDFYITSPSHSGFVHKNEIKKDKILSHTYIFALYIIKTLLYYLTTRHGISLPSTDKLPLEVNYVFLGMLVVVNSFICISFPSIFFKEKQSKKLCARFKFSACSRTLDKRVWGTSCSSSSTIEEKQIYFYIIFAKKKRRPSPASFFVSPFVWLSEKNPLTCQMSLLCHTQWTMMFSGWDLIKFSIDFASSYIFCCCCCCSIFSIFITALDVTHYKIVLLYKGLVDGRRHNSTLWMQFH